MTKVSVMFSTLATDEKDPAERLRVIASANTRAKEIHKMVGRGHAHALGRALLAQCLRLGAPASTRPCMGPTTIALCIT